MPKTFTIERGKMGWLLQAELNVASHSHQRAGHCSICLSKEKKKKIHDKNADTKEAMRRTIYRACLERNCDENATVHRFTTILFYKWCLATATKMRESTPVTAEGKGESEDTFQKALKIELVLLRSCRKTSLCHSSQSHHGKRTTAWLLPEEERTAFYPGPTGPRASEWHRQHLIPGVKLWDVVVQRNHRSLADQFISIWKTHSPNTEHHHPEGSCGQ